jgi:hypothetical protein
LSLPALLEVALRQKYIVGLARKKSWQVP